MIQVDEGQSPFGEGRHTGFGQHLGQRIGLQGHGGLAVDHEAIASESTGIVEQLVAAHHPA